MDFYPIYSPPALLRVEHEDVVLCLALGKQKALPLPWLSALCRSVCCRDVLLQCVDQALAGRSLYGQEVTVVRW